MANGIDEQTSNWTIDVQRGLAWTIVLVFAIVIITALLRVVVSAEISDINDVLKSGLAVLFNIVMLVLGFFFGSSKGSKDKDDTQNKIMEKITGPVVSETVIKEAVAAAASPAAAVAAPPAAEKAVEAALNERGKKDTDEVNLETGDISTDKWSKP